MIALGMTRNEYWRFLCRTYGMGALEAWDYIASRGLPPSAKAVRSALAAGARSDETPFAAQSEGRQSGGASRNVRKDIAQ